MSNRMPVLFIGHGSPMNIILNNSFTQTLHDWGKSLPKPQVILIISAHWLTLDTKVACTKQPTTIYDFYGFPEELYNIQYPCPGAPSIAEQMTNKIRLVKVKCDKQRGLDHGAWSILHHLFPDANIPTFQLSIDYSFNGYINKPLKYHYNLGKELAYLRDQGILIIGSGNIVHNLSLFDFEDINAKPYEWAQEFDQFIKLSLKNHEHYKLLEFQQYGKAAALAVPTWDHYLPMLYIIGMQNKEEKCHFIYEDFQYGSVSMLSFQIE